MVTSDQTHIDPAEYFSPDAYIPEQTLRSKYFYPVFCPVVGLATVFVSRYTMRKPVKSGIQLYVLAGTLGLPIGFAIENFIRRNCAKRDAMLYNYIKTHPEHFPLIERIKYRDVLERWAPLRPGR